ncbi:hypothetical protein [Muricauda brasiliensis]|uniref:hypothetical protein n=1 Tax=Muricauda brasiliensis TaxID=2162892 RepID=UPI000D373B94|nr:hypothetical protein [Muricauda brasiliensis]
MKRILIDYKKLSHDVAAKLIDSYPDGYGDNDIITIKKPNGEVIDAVEVQTEDTLYLVKISKSLSNFIASFEETIEKELDKELIASEFEQDSFENFETTSEEMGEDEDY